MYIPFIYLEVSRTWFLAFDSGHSSRRALSESEHNIEILFKMSGKTEENRS